MAPVYRILDGAIAQLSCKGVGPKLIAWALSVDIATAKRHNIAIQVQTSTKDLNAPRKYQQPLTLEQQSTIIAFYCQSTPLPGMQRWTLRTAADQINANPTLLGRTVHSSTIGRVLKRNHLRPHRNAYFLRISDPMFFEKMHHVLSVYALQSEYTFCFDECTSIQAISRGGPDVPENNGSTKRESVYKRNGTTDLFGFLQVSTGKISAFCRPSHETTTLIEVFTDHVLSQPADKRLHYICDNLNPHFDKDFCDAVANLSDLRCPSDEDLATGEKRRQWLQRKDKRIVVHFLPFHGSWLNHVEVWFGLLKRYTLDGSWFPSVDSLIATIQIFVRTWNEHLAHPFNFQCDGKGLENIVLRRFTRILSQRPEELAQLDSKFLADLSLLCVRLFNHHRHNVNLDDWNVLAEVVKTKRPELEEIIAAESDPKRRPRAQKAFDLFLEHLEI